MQLRTPAVEFDLVKSAAPLGGTEFKTGADDEPRSLLHSRCGSGGQDFNRLKWRVAELLKFVLDDRDPTVNHIQPLLLCDWRRSFVPECS
jgi:hypothetical protein